MFILSHKPEIKKGKFHIIYFLSVSWLYFPWYRILHQKFNRIPLWNLKYTELTINFMTAVNIEEARHTLQASLMSLSKSWKWNLFWSQTWIMEIIAGGISVISFNSERFWLFILEIKIQNIYVSIYYKYVMII